jgi:hypothetical protein
MNWHSGEPLWIACAIAAASGFVIGRWWSIGATVLAWFAYIQFIFPLTTVKGLEGNLNEILSVLVFVHIFATSWLIGIATAAGLAARSLIANRIIRRQVRLES